jgi:hypothetical protein
MKKNKRFAIVNYGDIEYLPEEIAQSHDHHFKTFTAAKQWVEAGYKYDIDHLRSRLSDLKRLRRDAVVRPKRK